MLAPVFSVFLLLTAITPPLFLSSASPDHFLKPSSLQRQPQEFIRLTHPLPPSDQVTSSCTFSLINYSFTNTIGRSPSTTIPYFPPTHCPQPWSNIILEFDAKCKGGWYCRIAGLWLGGVELLRTSTAEPSKSGSFWKVRKDITRYSSLLVQSKHNITMMLENMVDNGFNGFCHVDVILFFFKDKAVTLPSILAKHNSDSNLRFESDKYYYPPADMIIPISHDDGDQRAFWFRIEKESDFPFKKIKFPFNTHQVILELYVSFHGNDEYWYSNPPNSYIKKNNLTTGRGNGCYREVFVKIDGKLVASDVPFPVIFSSGINPFLWEPVVAIGAFSLPSYDMDLTPFLGLVLDGKGHKIGFGVKEAISFWLLNANMHIWIDHSSSKVIARSSVHKYPNLHIQIDEAFKFLDGKVDVKAKRRTEFSGWAKSSLGNFTTRVARQFRFRDLLKFDKNGSHKLVEHRVKVKRQVEVRDEMGRFVTRVLIRRWYPLDVRTSSSSRSKNDRFVIETNVSHLIKEECSIGNQLSSVYSSKVSGGLMEVKDHSMLSGEGNSEQSYSYRDEFGCYSRNVAARNGKLISDDTTSSCASAF